jgi:hypothetical protein
MLRLWLPLLFLIFAFTSCKQNLAPTEPIISSTCDTCRIDLGHGHTVHPGDTTSHNFRWVIYSLPRETYIRNVKVTAAGDVFVMGFWLYQLKAMRLVTYAPLDPQPIGGYMDTYSLFMFDYRDYWLIGGGNALQCVGTRARDVPGSYTASGRHELHACWGTSDDDIFAVGDNGAILHYDGSGWTKMLSNTTKSMYSIWGTSDSNIWASGTDLNNGPGLASNL